MLIEWHGRKFGLFDQAQHKIHICADLRAGVLQGMVILDLSCTAKR